MIPLEELKEEAVARLMACGYIFMGKPTIFGVSLENVDLDVPPGIKVAGLFKFAKENVSFWERQDGKTYVTVRAKAVVELGSKKA